MMQLFGLQPADLVLVLLLLATFGGALGACLGMVVWNHKTSHKRFRYLIPVFVLLQGLLAFYFLRLY